MPELMDRAAMAFGYGVMVGLVWIAISNEFRWARLKRRGNRRARLTYQQSWRGRLREWVVDNLPRVAWLRYPEVRRLVRDKRPDLHPFESARQQPLGASDDTR